MKLKKQDLSKKYYLKKIVMEKEQDSYYQNIM